MVGADSLAALSMDELAVRAGVSRATLYRLFPGKPALFTSLLRTYSPLEPVSSLVSAMRDQTPDVVMPEINGPTLVRHMAPLQPKMLVLYISGYTDHAVFHHGEIEPGAAFLEKPFTPDALARKVRAVLDRS